MNKTNPEDVITIKTEVNNGIKTIVSADIGAFINYAYNNTSKKINKNTVYHTEEMPICEEIGEI